MAWLYRWRFTNWLMAKPWPHRNGWRYRTIYRTLRRGTTRAETGGRWEQPSQGPLRAAWNALAFPHVHAPWED